MSISNKKSSLVMVGSSDGEIIYINRVFSQVEFKVGGTIFEIAGQVIMKPDEPLFIQTSSGILELHRVDTAIFQGYIGVLDHDESCDRVVSELEKSNNELEAIFESSHDGIVVTDAKGVFISVNSSYEKITGIPKSDILGFSAEEIVEKGIISDSATLRVLKSGGQHQTFSQTFRSGRQSVITASPIFDENNNIFRVVTNVRDMTEINVLREELAQSKEKLHQYTQIVDQLTTEQMLNSGLIFRSIKMEMVRDTALKFAKVDVPLLMTGESGVGKEVIANIIYKNSLRRGAPFLKINCGAIPEALLESELFGYEGGAFTGAKKDGSPGLFEMANGGTVLLDEIGELSLGLQVKLLRFVQQQEFYRVGGKKVVQVDVRLIAATNRDLLEMVNEKQFRTDLFYRLNVLKLNIPPLRERAEDIIPLANYFLDKFNKKYSVSKRISAEIYQMLAHYSWGGNVRELENLVERLVIVCEREEISSDYLPDEIKVSCSDVGMQNGEIGKTYKEAKEEFEKEFFRQAIESYKTSRRIAERLGINHSTIVKKAAKYSLQLSPRLGFFSK